MWIIEEEQLLASSPMAAQKETPKPKICGLKISALPSLPIKLEGAPHREPGRSRNCRAVKERRHLLIAEDPDSEGFLLEAFV
jgi:hypothetical protein